MHNVYDIAPYGFALSFLRWSDANSFLILYALVAYYFSNRMARLVILLGPVASALGGVALGFAFDQLILNASGRFVSSFIFSADDDADEVATAKTSKAFSAASLHTLCFDTPSSRVAQRGGAGRVLPLVRVRRGQGSAQRDTSIVRGIAAVNNNAH